MRALLFFLAFLGTSTAFAERPYQTTHFRKAHEPQQVDIEARQLIKDHKLILDYNLVETAPPDSEGGSDEE